MSRKRVALEDISPARAKRSNSQTANRNKNAQNPRDENFAAPTKQQAKSAFANKTAQSKEKVVVKEVDQNEMDVDQPKYSFDSCPYAAEIFQTQLKNEEKFFTRIGPGINWNGRSITPVMRTILINWLVEVAEEYRLRRETLFLAVNYVDRFLQIRENVERNLLQLIGITCILIAAKYEEIEIPRVDELMFITDNTYSAKEILATEKLILNDLDYDLTVSTLMTFLPRYLEVAHVNDPEIKCHAQFMADLVLTNYQLGINFSPSLLAASIVCLSRHTYGEKGLYGSEFLSFTNRTQLELKECAKQIWLVYKKAVHGAMAVAILEKFKSPKYCRVGLKSPSSAP